MPLCEERFNIQLRCYFQVLTILFSFIFGGAAPLNIYHSSQCLSASASIRYNTMSSAVAPPSRKSRHFMCMRQDSKIKNKSRHSETHFNSICRSPARTIHCSLTFNGFQVHQIYCIYKQRRTRYRKKNSVWRKWYAKRASRSGNTRQYCLSETMSMATLLKSFSTKLLNRFVSFIASQRLWVWQWNSKVFEEKYLCYFHVQTCRQTRLHEVKMQDN